MGRDNFVAPTASSGRRLPIPDVLGAVLGDTGKPVQVAVGRINTTGGTQMRAGLDDATVFEYGQAMIAAGGWGTFPAVTAYHDGKDYWLADGFHRVAAFLESFPDPKREIPVEVRAGTRRDAVLHAAGANASHGLRRTNQDKRRSVETLLRDEEWRQWSDGEIAKRCGVSQPFVSSVRRELATTQNRFESTARTGADGRTINTAKIGARPARAGDVDAQPAAETTRQRIEREQEKAAILAAKAEAAAATAHVAGMLEQATDGARAAIVSLDDLPVVASVTAPWAGPDPDEEITHPLDCYEDATANPYVGRMGQLHELKMWLKATRDQKLKEYQKLTGREVPAAASVAFDHMIAALEETMDAVEREAVADAHH